MNRSVNTIKYASAKLFSLLLFALDMKKKVAVINVTSMNISLEI